MGGSAGKRDVDDLADGGDNWQTYYIAVHAMVAPPEMLVLLMRKPKHC